MCSGVSFTALAELFMQVRLPRDLRTWQYLCLAFIVRVKDSKKGLRKSTLQQWSFMSVTTRAPNAIVPGTKGSKRDKGKWKEVSNSFSEHVSDAYTRPV